MTDLHSHLVFGFDDGAKDRDMCCRMLECYAECGVKSVCASGHSAANVSGIYRERFAETEALGKDFGITVLPALEYSLTDLLVNQEFSLGGSGCFLLDTANFPIDHALINKLMPLNAAGKSVLWAHPERLYPGKVLRNTEKYAMLRGGGCQINAASLLGAYGDVVRDAAWELLEAGKCAVIASDAHDISGVENFARAVKLLREIYPEEVVRLWTSGNPQRILAGEFPEYQIPPTLKFKQRLKRFFAK